MGVRRRQPAARFSISNGFALSSSLSLSEKYTTAEFATTSHSRRCCCFETSHRCCCRLLSLLSVPSSCRRFRRRRPADLAAADVPYSSPLSLLPSYIAVSLPLVRSSSVGQKAASLLSQFHAVISSNRHSVQPRRLAQQSPLRAPKQTGRRCSDPLENHAAIAIRRSLSITETISLCSPFATPLLSRSAVATEQPLLLASPNVGFSLHLCLSYTVMSSYNPISHRRNMNPPPFGFSLNFEGKVKRF